MGAAVQAFSKCYAHSRPDILLVLGDRFEMHAAALAALPFKIPVAHIHGGELTLGAIDNACRHSITMLSHLHFTATEIYRQRVLQFGEEPWRVHCVGAPALDEALSGPSFTLRELAEKFDLPLEEPPILVTYHPVTLEYENTEWQIGQLLQALSVIDGTIVFTGTNADTRNTIIWNKIKAFVSERPQAHLVINFGPDYYFSMLKQSRLMVGNSSSGLIEAPSFALPVVNIGSRQDGRVRAQNVIDVGYSKGEIIAGIGKALSEEFEGSLKGIKNPYDAGGAAVKILNCLKSVLLDQKLIFKQFVDYGSR
jgi:UDP-N-acetylglucosamine 2-epimerase (non-hydrolysing)/GDP/UDP-N,N'-diacetylbacillosamine 2-epimerase (hydrolysing)